LLNTDTSSTRSHNIVNFGLLTAEICWRVWSTRANFNRFRVLAAWRQPNCGVEQRAPPIFGRAAITLGIGPHSSCFCFVKFSCLLVKKRCVCVCARLCVCKVRYTLPVFTGSVHGPCSRSMFTRVSLWTSVLQVENNYDVINNSVCRSRWPVFTGVQK